MFFASKTRRAGASSEWMQQMRLNSKVTWGLAWTGLAVVLAVPSADFFTGQFGQGGNKAAVLTSTTEPVQAATKVASTKPVAAKPTRTATVTTKVTKDGVTIVPAGTPTAAADPVDNLLRKGKPLPDYISDGAAPPAATEPTQVASLDPAPVAVAPKPFPGRPLDLIGPSRPAPAVIVDEDPLDSEQALLEDPAGPVPPMGIGNDRGDPRLTQYLSNNGLLDGAAPDGRSSASVIVVKRPPADYDPDGFYLSDGPNNAPLRGHRSRLRPLFEDDGEDFDDFTLF